MKPIEGGVYFLYKCGELVYIGQSDNVYRRIGQHIAEKKKDFDDFRIYETDDYIRLESFLIGMFHPKYNQTIGNTIGWVNDRRDIFSKVIPSDKVLKIIHDIENSIGRRYHVRHISKEHPWMEHTFANYMMVNHFDEIPMYRCDGEWYIDANWYDDHKEELWALIDKWENEWRIEHNGQPGTYKNDDTSC